MPHSDFDCTNSICNRHNDIGIILGHNYACPDDEDEGKYNQKRLQKCGDECDKMRLLLLPSTCRLVVVVVVVGRSSRTGFTVPRWSSRMFTSASASPDLLRIISEQHRPALGVCSSAPADAVWEGRNLGPKILITTCTGDGVRRRAPPESSAPHTCHLCTTLAAWRVWRLPPPRLILAQINATERV